MSKSKQYCCFDRERECRPDCVAFDLEGYDDTTGKRTSCRFVEYLRGICAASVTIARKVEGPRKKVVPGQEIAPPFVSE